MCSIYNFNVKYNIDFVNNSYFKIQNKFQKILNNKFYCETNLKECEDNFHNNWRDWPEEVKLIIANMAFNLGLPRLKKFQLMFKALNKGKAVYVEKPLALDLQSITDIEESIYNPLNTAKINIIGNINIAIACIKNKVKKLIFASTIYFYCDIF